MTEASVRDPVCLGIALRRTDSLLSTDWCPLGAGSCPDAAGTHPPVAAELGLVAWKARKDRGLSVYTYNMYDIYIYMSFSGVEVELLLLLCSSFFVADASSNWFRISSTDTDSYWIPGRTSWEVFVKVCGRTSWKVVVRNISQTPELRSMQSDAATLEDRLSQLETMRWSAER